MSSGHEGQVEVLYIDNDGSGFAQRRLIEPGTTVAEFFRTHKAADARAEDYLVRVNREAVAPDQVLRHGDRIAISPKKIEGAC